MLSHATVLIAHEHVMSGLDESPSSSVELSRPLDEESSLGLCNATNALSRRRCMLGSERLQRPRAALELLGTDTQCLLVGFLSAAEAARLCSTNKIGRIRRTFLLKTVKDRETDEYIRLLNELEEDQARLLYFFHYADYDWDDEFVADYVRRHWLGTAVAETVTSR